MAPGYAAGYPQPYPGYPQQWGQHQPYPGQYPAPYPAGPYAQPAQPLPQSQHYRGPGKPTVPVMPVQIGESGADLVPPAAPSLDAAPGDLPADVVQIVPRVVATADVTAEPAVASRAVVSTGDKETVVETSAPVVEIELQTGEAPGGVADVADGTNDEWSGEKDW